MHVAADGDLIGYLLTSSGALRFLVVDTSERSVGCDAYNYLS